MRSLKTYSELIQLKTFEERMEYVRCNGIVGEATFAENRWINQHFYSSNLWKDIRRKVILRDQGCDLAMPGYDILGPVYIHHLNPITVDDIINLTDKVTNIEYLICVSFDTHNAVHYSNENYEPFWPQERKPNDTCPWRR